MLFISLHYIVKYHFKCFTLYSVLYICHLSFLLFTKILKYFYFD